MGFVFEVEYGGRNGFLHVSRGVGDLMSKEVW